MRARFPNKNVEAARVKAESLVPPERFSQQRFAEKQAEYIAFETLMNQKLKPWQIAEIVTEAQIPAEGEELTELFKRTVTAMVAGWRAGTRPWPKFNDDSAEAADASVGSRALVAHDEFRVDPPVAPPAATVAVDAGAIPEVKVAAASQPATMAKRPVATIAQPDLLGSNEVPVSEPEFAGFAGRVFKTKSPAVTKFFSAVQRKQSHSDLRELALMIERDPAAIEAMATIDPKDQRYFHQALTPR